MGAPKYLFGCLITWLLVVARKVNLNKINLWNVGRYHDAAWSIDSPVAVMDESHSIIQLLVVPTVTDDAHVY